MPSILSSIKSAREYITPTLKTSAFLTRGVLTPEEFVNAGDELVYKCPTWSWESGDPSKRKKHLPADKQYLMTRGVPCTARVSSLENVVAVSQNIHDGSDEGGIDGDGEWLVSQILTAEQQRQREEEALDEEFDILDEEGEVVKATKEMTLEKDVKDSSGNVGLSVSDERLASGTGEDDDEYADMADFEDEEVMADEAAAIVSAPVVNNTNNGDASVGGVEGLKLSLQNSNQHVLQVRTYDLSITYDKYYQTPRVWLMGYADDGTRQPLTGDEMMEDVIKDYANRTVTIEHHPHVSGHHASIHPCQHGAVMKTIVKNLTRDNASGSKANGSGEKEGSSNDGPTVEMYLFIFLKFVNSMIPTINYDFTIDVSASTKK